MLTIRLQRVGRRNDPSFRLVVTDSKNSTKSGKALEVIGTYDPRRGEKAVVDANRIKHWMSHGAKVSGTVHNMLISKKILEGKKINVLPKKRPILKEAAKTEAKVEAQTPGAEAASSTPELARAQSEQKA